MDILLHVIGASVITSVFVYAKTNWVLMAVFNAALWSVREVVQKDFDLSRVNHPEWIFPAAVGIFVAYGVNQLVN